MKDHQKESLKVTLVVVGGSIILLVIKLLPK